MRASFYNKEVKMYKDVTRRFFRQVPFIENTIWTVPENVTSIKVDCAGAQGNTGGYGGRVECFLSVTPKEILYLTIGKVPANWNIAEYNASDIRTAADDLNSRLVVAGGGGSRCNHVASGGAGGGLTGGAGSSSGYVSAGAGGTQTAGGAGGYPTIGVSIGHAHTAPNGSFGLGGSGTVCGYEGNGGAGGAGWYGGGGGSGAWNKVGAFTSTGGGGSSYANPNLCSEVIHTQGYQYGNGYISFEYEVAETDGYDYYIYTPVIKTLK